MSERYVLRSSAIASRLLGGEMMVMSATDSTFFTLNEVATTIWQAADGHTPLSEIVTKSVCRAFEVEPETALQDAQCFIDKLSGHGILLVSDQPLKLQAPGSSEAA